MLLPFRLALQLRCLLLTHGLQPIFRRCFLSVCCSVRWRCAVPALLLLLLLLLLFGLCIVNHHLIRLTCITQHVLTRCCCCRCICPYQLVLLPVRHHIFLQLPRLT
jgi:hypothetical protein